MPQLAIPLIPNKDIDEIGLTSHGATVVDMYFDSNGNATRRPGLVELCDFSVAAGVDALYWWDRQEKVIAVVNGRMFEITASNGTNAEISGDTFEVGAPVYWADFGTSLYGANGGKIVKIPSSGDAAYLADASAPTTVSHIATLDGYLIGLETGSQRAHFSTADPDVWDGEWVSAVSQPDLLKTLGVGTDILELLGTSILEGWRNDGSTPLVKESQYTVNRGVAAMHSFVFMEDTWYWLDEERKVIRLNGRQPEVLSLAMNKYIQGFDAVSDAIGAATNFDGRPQYVLIFPTEGKVLSYDIYNKFWSELGNWNSGTSSYDRFKGLSFTTAPKWNLTLVGDRATGKVYKFDSTDYQDDGSTLKSMIRTSHIHWDHPELWKRSSRLDFYLKKTSIEADADSAELLIKWRDQGDTTWKSQRTVDLGRVGKTDFHGHLSMMGHYKTRQYEIALTDDSPLVISKVMETFNIKGMRE